MQTPTLAILVEREEKIRKFVSRNYWELHATFGCEAGQYVGRWFDERFSKPAGKDADEALRADRIWDAAKASTIRERCLGKPGIVTEESKPSNQLSPTLFDLTTLQREANRRYGFSATRTLQIAQALYERHKVLTYPRTDSRALPEDYLGTARGVLETMNGGGYGKFAATILEQGWVRPNKRIFNNAKVSDHFAIIPTSVEPKNLSDVELRIYDMVAKRFLAVFYPAAEYLITTRITRVEGEPFKTDGKVLVKAGWLEIYGREAQTQNEGEEATANLVPVKPGERVQTEEIDLKLNQTKPPPGTTKPRCSVRWKVRASWSKTMNCARPWPTEVWAPRPHAPRSSKVWSMKNTSTATATSFSPRARPSCSSRSCAVWASKN